MPKIFFAGDVCFAGFDSSHGFDNPDILSLIRSCDMAVGNLESPITENSFENSYRSVSLKSQPKSNPLLDCFDVLSLANNHIVDYQEQGLADTVHFLHDLRKSYCGAGRNLQEAVKPAMICCGQLKLAFFGVTYWDNATSTKFGTAPEYSSLLFQEIRKAKKDGCFVVVMPHWGYEYVDYPSPYQRRLAKKMIHCGTDLIIGSHPHVVQGYEGISDKPVFYSLGNFVFHSKYLKPQGDSSSETFGLIVDIDPQSFQTMFSIHPVYTSDDEIRLMNEQEKEKFLTRWNHINQGFLSSREHAKRFYECAPFILAKTQNTLSTMKKKQGMWTIMKRLHRIRLQDWLIVFHAKFASWFRCFR